MCAKSEMHMFNRIIMQSLHIKERKLLELQITQTIHPKPFRSEKNSEFNTRQKLRKYFSNEHKIRDAHLQCVNNHYAKFEYKGMKSV